MFVFMCRFTGIWIQKQILCGYWRKIMRLFKVDVQRRSSKHIHNEALEI